MRGGWAAAAALAAAMSLAACDRGDDRDAATQTQAAPNIVVTTPEPANTVTAAAARPYRPMETANTTAEPMDAQMAEDAAATGMTARSSSTTTTSTTTTTTSQPASQAP